MYSYKQIVKQCMCCVRVSVNNTQNATVNKTLRINTHTAYTLLYARSCNMYISKTNTHALHTLLTKAQCAATHKLRVYYLQQLQNLLCVKFSAYISVQQLHNAVQHYSSYASVLAYYAKLIRVTQFNAQARNTNSVFALFTS